jgi:hypothetical protein
MLWGTRRRIIRGSGACGADFTPVFVCSKAVAGATSRVPHPSRYAKV